MSLFSPWKYWRRPRLYSFRARWLRQLSQMDTTEQVARSASSEVLPFIYCACLSVLPLLHLHHIMGCLFACLQTAAPHVDGRVYYRGKCGCSDVSGEHQRRRSPLGTVTHAPVRICGNCISARGRGALDTLFKLRKWISNPNFPPTNSFRKFLDCSQLFFCRSDAGTCPFFLMDSSRRCFCSFHICCLKVNEVLIRQLSFVCFFYHPAEMIWRPQKDRTEFLIGFVCRWRYPTSSSAASPRREERRSAPRSEEKKTSVISEN